MDRISTPPEVDGNDQDWPSGATVEWDERGSYPVSVKLAYDDENLYLFYRVEDDSPWTNQGFDWQVLFKTGDGVDLQLGADLEANRSRRDPVPGDLRLFFAPSAEGDVAILYRHRVPGATDSKAVIFQSPLRNTTVDVVEKLESADFTVRKGNGFYTLEARVPLEDLGLSNLSGATVSGDVGVIYGDREGTINLFRNYWSNQATGLVDDVPGEIMLFPNLWGEFHFGGNE